MIGYLNLDPPSWAAQTFGAVQLGDRRRDRRLVQLATAFVRNPSASLPHQLHSPKVLKAAYRLFATETLTHAQLLAPHFRHTRGLAGATPLVLFAQDTTTLDFSHHPTTQNLGPIGDGGGRGFLLHTTLAIVPAPRQVLGIAHQEPFVRQPVSPDETCAQRRHRDRESQVWSRAVTAVGPPPPGATWVHVGDAESDIFEFLAVCQAHKSDFLIRAAQDRRVTLADGTSDHLIQLARRLPAAGGTRRVALRAQGEQAARVADVSVAWRAVCLRSPRGPREQAPLRVWVLHVWEAEAPAEVEGLEWILVTSVPTERVAEAWERVDWYTCRWLDEDYHQCLKSGCRFEQRQLQSYEGLARLLGVVAPVAVHLLQMREAARLEPERLAREMLPAEVVEVVALLGGKSAGTLEMGMVWQELAKQGGHLGRTRDGPPGWKTIWRGWHYVQTLVEGVQLARRLPQDTYG
jgi:hypothetical protein